MPSTISLSDKMHNGASVSDWLGTAMTAARVAANRIESIRDGSATSPGTDLDDAIAYLTQALDEARAVQMWTA